MQGQEQYIKEKVKERYGRIALTGNPDCCCCAPEEICGENGSPLHIMTTIPDFVILSYFIHQK
jgi:hypothetical protein